MSKAEEYINEEKTFLSHSRAKKLVNLTLEDVEGILLSPITRILTYIGEEVEEGVPLAIELDKELREIDDKLKNLKI